jgi:hypothetical protein
MNPPHRSPSGPPPLKKPKAHGTARNATLINLFVTPGMGSLMAGQILEGIGQLLLALAGFALVVAWFFRIMVQYYGMIDGQLKEFDARPWLGIGGAILFGVAWLWALATSLRILRRNRAQPPELPRSSNQV